MVRKLGQLLVAAVLFAAGCRDLTMDLLPAPPRAAAGAGNESAGGMAGDGPAGYAAEGGSGGRAGGFSGGGFGASGPCPFGYPGCPPCVTDESCFKVYGIPFCSPAYGRCVQCLTPPDCPAGGRCGCEPDQICAEGRNSCVPRCNTDNDCDATAMFTGWPYCDRPRNACVECTTEKHCESHSRTTLCNEFTGKCVECFSNDDCDEDAPICNLSNLTGSNVCERCTDMQCGEGRQCQCGEGKQCRDGRCIIHASPPQPEP